MRFDRLALVVALALPSSLRAQCGNSQGITPLNDLGAGTYQGFVGGLYPGGSNTPPPAHLTAAVAEANAIEPLDALGAPDAASGLIGMISIGMSNTTHEYAAFERAEDQSVVRNPRVVIFGCSQGGQAAEDIAPAAAPYWTLVEERVTAAGLTNAQVQVAWIKEAMGTEVPGFPSGALALESALVDIARNLRAKFPNLRIAYVSSRTYGGYNTGHTEPIAFEGGFAFKWLIEDQIAGDPALNFDPGVGAVEAPLLLWGPYLWADGDAPRSDGLTWCPSDFENDGTHPSPAGEQKVASMLSAFFASDPTAQPWWPNPGLVPLAAVDTTADASVLQAQPGTNFGTETTLRLDSQPSLERAYLRFDVSALHRPVLYAKLSLRSPEDSLTAAPIGAQIVPDTTWNEATITWTNAPPPSGALLSLPSMTRDGARALDVTDWVNADSDGVLSIALIGTVPQATLVDSRESGGAPRLVLTLRPESVASYCTAKTNSLGCVPAIGWSGFPSASDPAPFEITAANVLSNKPGILFYGYASGAIQFQCGTKCVVGSTKRTPLQGSNGNAAIDCSGTYAYDMNARIQSGADPALVQGATGYAQYWSRDAGYAPPCSTGLTDGVSFTIEP